MISFSTDADILKYEPILFSELYLPRQVLATATNGQLSGTTFNAAAADFSAAQVAANGAIYLRSADGLLDGSYEIVAVDSATQLTVSVVRANCDDEPIAPPAASEITYRVSTFAPQAIQVAYQLTEYFGVKPGNPASEIEVQDILNTDVLKRASAFAVISHVYAMLASKADDSNFWKKSLHYQRLFEKARQRCQLSIDTGQDGVADVVKDGSAARLMRD
jgi:hypothetical protein